MIKNKVTVILYHQTKLLKVKVILKEKMSWKKNQKHSWGHVQN